MIAGDKNLLTATLTQGVLNIQGNLITLYSRNINGMAVQAALIAGFCWTGYVEVIYPIDDVNLILAYFFYPLNALCFITTIYIVSQASLGVIFGPTAALTGDTAEHVMDAIRNMRYQQEHLFIVGFACISLCFITNILLTYARVSKGPATVTMIFILGVYYVMIVECKKTYNLFQVPKGEG